MNNTKDIFVFLEVRNDKVMDGSLQLLGESRKLVEQIKHVDFDVVGVLLGHNVKHLAEHCFDKGADKVIVLDHEKLAHYSTQHYTNALVQVAKNYQPDSFLIAATTIGRDCAPRVAARLNTGLTADATQIEIDPETENSTTLWVTRPAFGGNLFGTIVCPNTRPQMSTIRPNVFEELAEKHSSKAELIELDYTTSEEDLVVFKQRIEKPAKGVNLDKAEVILSAGRGLKDEFDLVVETAQEIGATPGASRALVDAHIAKKDFQVGQTGTTVKPRVYVAMGISGAVQHTAGMDKSEMIIAINTDPHAAIFSIANVGYVADAKKVLPLLKKELEKLL